MRLSDQQIAFYRERGHLTVPGVFSDARMAEALADAEAWGTSFQAGLSDAEKQWYLEDAAADTPRLRKLDNPVFERPVFRVLAADETLVAMVRQLIGDGLSVAFSQIFLKPAEGGGPKPVHQDNFYFGCDERDGMVTAWLALDEATVENGCLFFAEGSNKGPVYGHIAPPDRPFDLQVPPEEAGKHPMTPAPVPRGGVSFHHGNTLHQSSENRSGRPRRAVAMHYLNRRATFASPALTYDPAVIVAID